MHRRGLLVLTLVLAALPAAAQPRPAPSCDKGAFKLSSGEEVRPVGTYKPLAVEQRLFYGLTGLGAEPLEVRYFVKGALHLTEAVDLSSAKLPRINPEGKKLPLEVESQLELEVLLEAERMVELLALRPDLVRQLHQTAQDGARIEIKVFQAGRRVESLSYKELMRRSADLRASRAVPVAVHSTVQGPGDRGEPRAAFTKEYLPDCGDCTVEMPCETECGWDPGKGGPVTCREQGQPCGGGGGCSCQVSSEAWTDWYLNSFHPASPAQYDCLYSRWGGSRWHQLFVKQYRRDRIRYSTICPNCPACTGCYQQEQVINYELGAWVCLYEVGGFCGFGRLPGCYELCEVYYNTPCN